MADTYVDCSIHERSEDTIHKDERERERERDPGLPFLPLFQHSMY